MKHEAPPTRRSPWTGRAGRAAIVKGGVVVAARATGAVLVPDRSMRRGLVLAARVGPVRLAWPFTRVDVVLGAPIDPRATMTRGTRWSSRWPPLNGEPRRHDLMTSTGRIVVDWTGC